MKKHPYARYMHPQLAKLLAELNGHPTATDEDRRLAEAIVDRGWSCYPPEISQDEIHAAVYEIRRSTEDGQQSSWYRALAIALRRFGLWVEGDCRDL